MTEGTAAEQRAILYYGFDANVAEIEGLARQLEVGEEVVVRDDSHNRDTGDGRFKFVDFIAGMMHTLDSIYHEERMFRYDVSDDCTIRRTR